MSSFSAEAIAAHAGELPPFRTVPLDRGTWARHLARARAEGIVCLSVKSHSGPGGLRWQLAIQGSKGDVYTVRVRPALAGDGVEASCSCPAGVQARHWCKHIAASLEALEVLPPASSAFWESVVEALAGAAAA